MASYFLRTIKMKDEGVDNKRYDERTVPNVRFLPKNSNFSGNLLFKLGQKYRFWAGKFNLFHTF